MATFNTQFFNDFISFARFIVWIIKWCLTIRFWNTTSLLKIQKFLDILNFLFIVRTVVKHLLSQTLWSFFAKAGQYPKLILLGRKAKERLKNVETFKYKSFLEHGFVIVLRFLLNKLRFFSSWVKVRYGFCKIN